MDTFVEHHLQLLSKEREEELSEGLSYLASGIKNVAELEDKGCIVTKLVAESQKIGLFGKAIVGFERTGKRKIPANSLSSGDIVGVFSNNKSVLPDKLLSGVVLKAIDTCVTVAFEDIPEKVNLNDFSGSLQLVKLANDVTYRRLKRSLESLSASQSDSCGNLIKVLFNEKPPSPPNPKWRELIDQIDSAPTVPLTEDRFRFFNQHLDSSQQRAVLFALSQQDVAIIHGPPGTGKTTTVVEYIMQCAQLHQKVLACAPSNIAVDNLAERLASKGVKIVRLGHPARLVPSVLHHSLDSLLINYSGSDIIKDIRKEMSEILVKLSSSKSFDGKHKWRSDLKVLRKELLEREDKILKEILSKAEVILATNTGASNDGPLKHLPKSHFDVIVIDECAQALEASCWIPLSHGPKCVLAGDHKQLPPTILSIDAAKDGLSVTLMERLVKLYGDLVTSMLTTQYRMHHHIMEWPSKFLYKGVLTAHQSVANHLLKDLPSVLETPLTSSPMLYIDTAGCGLHEKETESENSSKGNEGEADIVLMQVRELLSAGLSPDEISIIAPYNLQVDLIKQRLNDSQMSPLIEVHTVDGFQGREKESVIISFTRSNEKGVIGFLREQRRTNVAVTRARRHLSLIGDSSTISRDPFIKGLIEYCTSHCEIHSGNEYIQSINYDGKDGGRHDDTVSATPPQLPSTNIQPKAHQPLVSYPDLVKQYKQTLVPFNEDKLQGSLSFTSLTSAQRKALYEASEGLGLYHVSEGEGKRRVVTVTKTDTTTTSHEDITITPSTSPVVKDDKLTLAHAPQPSVESPTIEIEQTKQHEIKDKENHLTEPDVTEVSQPITTEPPPSSATANLWKCPLCGYVVPTDNKDLHELRCSREQRRTIEERDSKIKQKKIEKLKNRDIDKHIAEQKRKDKRKKDGGSKASNDHDDLDTMIAEMKALDNTCRYTECKKNVSMLGMRCEHCHHRFCTSHMIPEVHGCGVEAKRKARDAMMRDALRRERGTEGGKKQLNSTKRAQLHRKLDSKIEELTNERQRKKKSQK